MYFSSVFFFTHFSFLFTLPPIFNFSFIIFNFFMRAPPPQTILLKIKPTYQGVQVTSPKITWQILMLI